MSEASPRTCMDAFNKWQNGGTFEDFKRELEGIDKATAKATNDLRDKMKELQESLKKATIVKEELHQRESLVQVRDMVFWQFKKLFKTAREAAANEQAKNRSKNSSNEKTDPLPGKLIGKHVTDVLVTHAEENEAAFKIIDWYARDPTNKIRVDWRAMTQHVNDGLTNTIDNLNKTAHPSFSTINATKAALESGVAQTLVPNKTRNVLESIINSPSVQVRITRDAGKRGNAEDDRYSYASPRMPLALLGR